MLDYEILRVIWWGLLGVLLIGFAIMDGFDLGVATLLPWIAKSDTERRVMINSVGPVWEGNQVWLILGAGAIFAAWPALYATVFSGFYLAMFVVLVSLILRPVGFKFRSKIENRRWRLVWDWVLFAGGFVPALIFGVAVGNVIQGVPFRFDAKLLPIYEGGFFALLNPFALLCGVLSVVMLVMHGGNYLVLKTEGVIRDRARRISILAAGGTILLFALGGLWVSFGIEGLWIVGEAVIDGPSNPLRKTVAASEGAWLANYAEMPWMLIAPVLGFLGSFLVIILLRAARPIMAFIASSLAIFGVIATVGVSMFPFILPSTIDAGASLTVWDASSSQLTLFIMLLATLVFMPIVIIYTSWVFSILRGPVTQESVEADQQSY